METEKLKVFISQPIGDRTYEEVELIRQSIVDKLIKYFDGGDKITIADLHFNLAGKQGVYKNESLYWLAKSLEILSECDIIVMASGWEKARGCRIEYECARLYDIMVIFEDTEYITQEQQLEVDNDSTSNHKLSD